MAASSTDRDNRMTDFMHFISFIGSAGFYVPVLAVVFWCVSPRAGAWAAVVLMLSGALNTMLKVVIHAPRPYWTDPAITAHETRASFGMPSGHAQGSAVAAGLLGGHTSRGTSRPWSIAIWAGLAAVVVLVGVSRVYLGVHSAGQVLAGWLIGAAVLLAARLLGPVVTAWWRRRPLWTQQVLGLAVALALLAPMVLAVWDLRGRQLPGSWARAIEAAGVGSSLMTLTDGATVTGMLFGVLAGVSWLAHRGWFEPGGPPWRRIARLPVGATGVAVILLCGGLAGDAPAVVFVTQAAAGAWLTGGAPEAFVRLGLAARPRGDIPHTGELAAGRHS
jgi:membrane-associated phospholipid phosphatase